MDGASLYMLRCADGKLYIGLTRREVDERVSEHQQGLSAFTRPRRPVALIFSEHYPSLTDAIAAERRLKGWTRAKKLAYAAAEWERLQHLARRRTSSRDVLGARGEAEAGERTDQSGRYLENTADPSIIPLYASWSFVWPLPTSMVAVNLSQGHQLRHEKR